MPQQINVLMTGAGAPGAPGIIKCLLQAPFINLTVGDRDPKAVGAFLHPSFVLLPDASEEAFAEKMIAIGVERNIHIILPLVTKELFPFAKKKDLFENAGINVLVSSDEAIQIANDKGNCYRFLASKNIRVPKFYVVNTVEEFIQAAENLEYPQKPFCFKPSVANGSRGFRIVSSSINESHLLFYQKPYQTYITYEDIVRILSAQSFPQLLVTEFLPGDEYSVDCIADKGKAILIVPRIRTKMINGISVQGRFVHDTPIINYCVQLIEAIRLHGNIGIQVKKSEGGEIALLEINPRVQGSIVAALGAGVNLPLLAIKLQACLEIEKGELAVQWGTAFSRYWTEVFYGTTVKLLE